MAQAKNREEYLRVWFSHLAEMKYPVYEFRNEEYVEMEQEFQKAEKILEAIITKAADKVFGNRS